MSPKPCALVANSTVSFTRQNLLNLLIKVLTLLLCTKAATLPHLSQADLHHLPVQHMLSSVPQPRKRKHHLRLRPGLQGQVLEPSPPRRAQPSPHRILRVKMPTTASLSGRRRRNHPRETATTLQPRVYRAAILRRQLTVAAPGRGEEGEGEGGGHVTRAAAWL